MTKPTLLYQAGFGDYSSPEIIASGIVSEWEQTEQGRWAKKHCSNEKTWYICDINIDENDDSVYAVKVYGNMSDRNLTYYRLKWNYKE